MDTSEKDAEATCLKRLFQLPGAYYALLVITIWFGLTQPAFLTLDNLAPLTRQYGEIGIIAIGMTLVIATVGIDISVGGTAGMASVIFAVLTVQSGVSVLPAALITLGGSLLVGIVNGIVIGRFKVQPVLVTLATMSATRGIAYIMTSGVSIAGLPSGFVAFSQAEFSALRISSSAVVLILIWVTAVVVVRQTAFGRQLLAVGENEKAARLSGINVFSVKLLAYGAASVLAGVAGLMVSSRMATGFPSAGETYEFEAITAVVLGGTSLAGGKANLAGTLAGIACMAALRNGLSLAGYDDLTRKQALAIVLLLAVALDSYRQRNGW